MAPEIRWLGTDGLAPDEIIQLLENDLESVGQMRAKAKGLMVRFETMKSVVKSELMKKHSANHETAAAQEREAYADPEYREFAEKLGDAVGEFERWDAEYWRLKNKLEIWREHQANERAKMRLW